MDFADAYDHQPVLLEEVLAGLAIRPNGLYLDATFGRGGHSAALLERLGEAARVLALDVDPAAIAVASQRLEADPRLTIEHASFANLGELGARHGLAASVDGLLLDLGVSSAQLDDPRRGFSFSHDGPLDMRMDPTQGEPASAWLAGADERSIADVLKTYGEERHARRIARAIVQARSSGRLDTTAELAALVGRVVGRGEPNKHPATRTFQAIRIFVNGELHALEAALTASLALLATGGRLAVISFHSLEDRIVKRFIRAHSRGAQAPRKLPVRGSVAAGPLRALGRTQRPSAQELARNPRARSAVLRLAERRAEPAP